MDSKTYWEKREAEALKYYISEEKEYQKRINRIYADMLDGINAEILRFYAKYAINEGITIAEAKKRVSRLDIEEYERKAERYVRERNFSKQANTEMRLYNATMKINRLEMLKANIGLELIKGHSELEEFMEEILQGRTEDELKRQAGILGDTVRDNAKAAHSIVNASFHNATFSQRIWMHNDTMKADLSKLLQSGLIRGKNPRVLAKEMRKYVLGDAKGGAEYNAERLMRTELGRVQIDAQLKSFKGLDFEEYMFHANTGCCDACLSLDGKHFKISEALSGENLPPMHPNCRCSVSAYADDEGYEDWIDFLSSGGTTEQWNEYGKSERKRMSAKSVEMPKELVTAKNIPSDIKSEIAQAIDKVCGEYNVTLGRIEYAPYFENTKAPFTYIPCEIRGKYSAKLNINSLFDWNESLEEFNDRIYNKNYKRGVLASKNAEDLIYHEAAHFITFQDCQSFDDFRTKEAEVRRKFVYGVSGYSDATEDGAETIAEAFVRRKNGEEISDREADLLTEYIDKYIKR